MTLNTVDLFSHATYAATADYIRSRLPDELKTVEFGIVCGSGLGGLVHCFDTKTVVLEFDYKDIPNFAISTVAGHAGKLVFGFLSGRPTVCMVGRHHFYEGHALTRTILPIRIMHLLGAHSLILTNASGGLNPSFNVGDIVVLSDHISMAGLAGINPLIGPNLESFGPRFPAVSDAYDFKLRVAAVKAARVIGMPKDIIREGVYCFVTGPSFETRAEARMLRNLGADCVGMSTVPEVVAARHCGMRVLGLSLVTNAVAVGVGRSAIDEADAETLVEGVVAAVEGVRPISVAASAKNGGLVPVKDDELKIATHAEVLETSKARSEEMQELVRKIVEMAPRKDLDN
ncbi:hypothetical protein HK104_000037 [Borealophlyctis nickersoniae]|nr:hypothetical protein HK104_000037 [Borealophlyctis nickersoniae]